MDGTNGDKVKAATLVVCALVITAVGGPRRLQLQTVSREPTLVEAFDVAALLRVEFHGGAVEVIVIGPEIDEATAAVLKRSRAAIPLKEVPASPGLNLPARYFLLKSFQLGKDRGAMSGTLGPVPAPRPGLMACGTTFKLDLDRSSGTWQAKVAGITVC